MSAPQQNADGKASPQETPEVGGRGSEVGQAARQDVGQAVPKGFLRSKTILGVIVGVLPYLLSALGLEFENAEVQNLATTGTAFLSAIFVVWGRATAKQPIAVVGGRKSEVRGGPRPEVGGQRSEVGGNAQ